jgi:putative ABC transport system permease protein
VRGIDPGFRAKNILTVGLPKWGGKRPTGAEIDAWQRDVLLRVRSIPGVVSAGFTNHIPIAFKGDITRVSADGQDRHVQCRARTAGPGYLETMGITVRRGRSIESGDFDGAQRVAIVNETLARELWPGHEALGRKLVFAAGVSVPVVGVIGDIRQHALDSESKPEFYISSLQAGFHPSALAIRTAVDPISLASAVRQAVWSIDPEQPVIDVRTMEQILDQEVWQRRLHGLLLTVFAGLALLLASVGLYGVLACWVGERLPEFGVRIALGASPRDLLGGVLTQGVGLTGIGLAAGLAGALALSHIISSFLFGVGATDPTTYIAVAGLLLFTAVFASYVPARRAMRVDPAVALRQE